MALNKVVGRNRFCGPAALSAIFGVPTHEASKLIRKANGKSSVMGMYNHEMIKTLKASGVQHELLDTSKKPTVNQFINSGMSGKFILTASRHYIAVDLCSGQFADSGAWGAKKPLPLSGIKKPKARVTHIIRILGGQLQVAPKAKPKPKPTCFADLIKNYGTKQLCSDMSYRAGDVLDTLNSIGMSLIPSEGEEYDSKKHYHENINSADRMMFDDICELYGCEWTDETKASVKTIRMLAGKYKF